MARTPIADGEKVLTGVRFDVYRVDYPRRGGGVHRREVVAAPDAAVILPLLDEQTVVLIRNQRFSVGQTLLEVPAGTLEAGEDPAQGAERELIEETGYAPGKIRKLCAFYPTPGFCTEFMHLYLAEDLTFRGQHLDETERIEVETPPLEEAIKMIGDGRIVDGKTIAALLYYRVFQMKAKD